MPNQAISDQFVGHLCFHFNFRPTKNGSGMKINIISYTQVPDLKISSCLVFFLIKFPGVSFKFPSASFR